MGFFRVPLLSIAAKKSNLMVNSADFIRTGLSEQPGGWHDGKHEAIMEG